MVQKKWQMDHDKKKVLQNVSGKKSGKTKSIIEE